MSKINYIAEIAQGLGDPQCYKGKAGGEPKFKVGDQVRIRELPDVFYTQTPTYTRGILATIDGIVYESPAPEDEAWGHIEEPEWFYSVVFKQRDLWPDYPEEYSNDTLSAEMTERWLELA
ncbi:MAG: nitrile hydratase subunit beta [Desulfobulbaceae bacterium]|nr:nitrile hydratase subunit beta [Gammaproteobacteria bacterium]MCP4126128.1 nitrile hydratase subunit beta [Gammaproteobacteria bacterium]MCP4342992.1 nitrile hydratase subunit beta [Desulfobulbaceae bacterium]